MSYADQDKVKILTKEVAVGIKDDTIYSELLSRAIDYADNKINNKLDENNIPPPSGNNAKLTEAGNLYAAAMIFNTYYSSNDTQSPTARTYREDADELVKGYIKNIEKTTENNDLYSISTIQGHSLREVLHNRED